MIFADVTATVGNTPMVELARLGSPVIRAVSLPAPS